jgi:hypothetical protein
MRGMKEEWWRLLLLLLMLLVSYLYGGFALAGVVAKLQCSYGEV